MAAVQSQAEEQRLLALPPASRRARAPAAQRWAACRAGAASRALPLAAPPPGGHLGSAASAAGTPQGRGRTPPSTGAAPAAGAAGPAPQTRCSAGIPSAGSQTAEHRHAGTTGARGCTLGGRRWRRRPRGACTACCRPLPASGAAHQAQDGACGDVGAAPQRAGLPPPPVCACSGASEGGSRWARSCQRVQPQFTCGRRPTASTTGCAGAVNRIPTGPLPRPSA